MEPWSTTHRLLSGKRGEFPDHRFAVIEVKSGSRAGLVLLDLATGASRTIAEDRAVAGAFSPDGCWVAVTTEDGAGSSLRLIPVEGGEPISLPGGSMPVWVQP